MRYFFWAVILLGPSMLQAEETFVTIHGVSGNRLQISRTSAGGQGMGRRGRGAGVADGQPENMGIPGQSPVGNRGGRGRARFGGQTQQPIATVVVPMSAKVTTAMRERRTFEFRVMGEIPGGLRSPIFTRMKSPMQARIVTRNNTITEVNVITGDTDINQTSTSAGGESIIAVKPKRPPMKRK